MELQTKLTIPQEKLHPIDYGSTLVFLGSCFSDTIGSQFEYFKFNTLKNPFGVLFQPSAIENLIEKAINQYEFTEKDVFLHEECWRTFDAHSSLSHPELDLTLQQLNQATTTLREGLQNATHLCITLGSSWVYRHIETDRLVANCHKLPQKKFLKEILDIDTIENHITAIIELVKSINPKIAILFTISPVRHLKDGIVENQRSKAHLIAAVHVVVNPRERVFYFPSFELLLDELRDYRFYSEDLIHPNTTAVAYIWARFKDCWITEEAQQLMQKVNAIQKGLAHRFLHKDTLAEKKFSTNLKLKIEELKKQFPFLKF